MSSPPLNQGRAARVNLIKEQLGMIAQQCKLFDENSFCPVKYNIFKRRLALYNSEVTSFIEDTGEEVANYLTSFQLECEDVMAKLDLLALGHTNKTKALDRKSAKLPTMELTKFDGDVLKWQEFHDIFCSNIDERDLSDVDKMLYLKSVLEGKAKEVIEGIQATNVNYKVALQTLRERFGNKVLLVDSHYTALNNIKKASQDNTDCRRALNEIERHLRVLSALGENTSGNHLRSIIMSKFPEQLIYEVNLRLKEEDRTSDRIRANLEQIIKAKEQTGSHEQSEHFTIEALMASTSKPDHSKKQNPNKRKQTQAPDGPSAKKGALQPCVFCQQLHYNDLCPLPLEERKSKLKGKCYICFKSHIAARCLSKRRCFYCKSKFHNRAICDKQKGIKKPTNTLVSHCTSLQTALVMLNSSESNSKSILCRAILDTGSQRSYVTSEVAKQLKLKQIEENSLIVYTFGSPKPKEIHSPIVELNITTRLNVNINLQANVIPFITGLLRNDSSLLKLIKQKINNKIIIADDYSVDAKISLLIGNDYYFEFVKGERIYLEENLFLIQSVFGWLIAGRYKQSQSEHQTLSVITYANEASHALNSNFVEPDLPLKENTIKFIWELETLGITDSPKSTRDEEAIDNFNKTVKNIQDRYYVTWPWISFPPDLPTNFGLAFGRLSSLIKRLDSGAIMEYDSIIKEQMNNGIVEIITIPSTETIKQTIPPIHYIPHHMVHQDGKRGRIVYDASAKTKDNNSLNECLYKGPLMLEDLTAMLINFRTHKVGVIADIEKAFLQVGLLESERDVTRFLWLKDINKGVLHDNLLHMRFTRVPFGIVSSPFLLTATIRYHMAQTNPELLKTIANKCYADNFVSGANSNTEALHLYEETRSVFEKLSMNIRDWTTNSKCLREEIPMDIQSKNADKVKVLGLVWDTDMDSLHLKLNSIIESAENEVHTKRGVLKVIGSVYDPCGLAAPILLPIKLFLQELWRNKTKWDSPLSDELMKQWQTASKGLQEIININVPRCITPSGSTGHFQLHCFTDAALNAYAAVVYLLDNQSNQVFLVMAKSRIAPLKDKNHLSIPKLELLGVLIGSRLIKYVRDSLQLEVSRLILWSDNTAVLSWIRSNKLLSPFVARRIAEIKQNKSLELRYVPTTINPADIGTKPQEKPLNETIWFTGPQFLKMSELEWPQWPTEILESTFVAGEGLSNTEVDDEDTSHNDQPDPECDEESAKIREIQKLHFPKEYKGKVTDLSRALHLYKDEIGLLRCKGRFQNAEWSDEQKFPILLPRDAEFTYKLIENVHKTNYHVGVSHTLALLRKKYWVTKGRSTVQKVIRRCIQCHKYSGGPFKLPPMPPLPEERVKCCPAFSYTGVDYMGPLLTSAGSKRWICVLTCLSIRAIHMEVVNDLTAEEFNLALRRFIATRGLPLMFTSDNGTQMKLMAQIITSKQCIDNDVKWRFIPELSPWVGGYYERLMSLIKHCMKRTIEKQLLNDQQLLTVIKEIEAVLNTRPLTYVSDEVEHVLSPIDFLRIGGPVVTDMSEERLLQPGTDTKERLIHGWKHGQKVIQEFSTMFSGQYLPYLRQRNSVHKEPRVTCNRVPKEGEVVQIKREGNRAGWKVGKIIELEKSKDSNIRVAKVRTTDGKTLRRSIAHLYPLELDNEVSVQANNELTPIVTNAKESPVKETVSPESRPKRQAAIKARELLRQMTELLLARQY